MNYIATGIAIYYFVKLFITYSAHSQYWHNLTYGANSLQHTTSKKTLVQSSK